MFQSISSRLRHTFLKKFLWARSSKHARAKRSSPNASANMLRQTVTLATAILSICISLCPSVCLSLSLSLHIESYTSVTWHSIYLPVYSTSTHQKYRYINNGMKFVPVPSPCIESFCTLSVCMRLLLSHYVVILVFAVCIPTVLV